MSSEGAWGLPGRLGESLEVLREDLWRVSGGPERVHGVPKLEILEILQPLYCDLLVFRSKISPKWSTMVQNVCCDLHVLQK